MTFGEYQMRAADSWKYMLFNVWGTRGSFPAVSGKFMEYGGNTSCFSVLCGDILIVLDAGSGLAQLGAQLSQGARNIRSIHMLISHTHIDHIMGLYLFLSQLRDRFELHIYGRSGLGKILDEMTAPSYWPYSAAQSGAQIHELNADSQLMIESGGGNIRISSMNGTHPGGCLWYRIEYGGSSVVYMLDCEIQETLRPAMLRFAANADLLVWDAGDVLGQEKKGWGHSTWKQGAEFAQEAGAAKILMAHYGWSHEDTLLRQMEMNAEAAGQPGSASIFAKEGMVLFV